MVLFASFLIAAVSDLPKSLAEEYSFPEGTAVEELLDPEPQYVPPPSKRSQTGGVQFSVGAIGGYLKAREADRGTWFAGLQLRLHFAQYLALEVSGTYHQNRYEDGDIKVTQYPVQVSGVVYPLPNSIVSPYFGGGAGWYYTRIGYSGGLAGFSDETKHPFGEHAVAGIDLKLGKRFTINADYRYIFLQTSGTQIPDGDLNYWQATFGVNINF
jgi:opacity protein-like surface antigen